MIRLLRERGLGNSPTRVLKQLRENHTEEWLHRVARYTTECVGFLQRPALLPMAFPEPPEPAVVPTCKWLLSVYSQDILTRLEEIKAKITSNHGTILKWIRPKRWMNLIFLNRLLILLTTVRISILSYVHKPLKRLCALDHQEACRNSQGDSTVAHLCWKWVWSDSHQCADR